MTQDEILLLDTLQEAENELCAWKSAYPDRAGATKELVKKIHALILKYRPEPDFGTAIDTTKNKEK